MIVLFGVRLKRRKEPYGKAKMLMGMEEIDMETLCDPNEYDTVINVIGSLKDCSVILKVFDTYFAHSGLQNEMRNRDVLNVRTEKSKARLEQGITKTFVRFVGPKHEELFSGIFKNDVPMRDKELILFWQFALNNRLFREISLNVFTKTYYSGRTSISKEDVTAYLKDFLGKNKSLRGRWSEITVSTLSTKYLNLMTKLNFVSSGRTKLFKHVRPTSEAQVLFLYFAELFDSTSNNLLTNEFLSLSFIPIEDIHDKLKKLSLKGFFDMSFNGVSLNIELTHSYKGICDVLYKRS